MDIRAVLFVLGNLLLVLGACLLLPLSVELFHPLDEAELFAFALSAAVALTLGLAGRRLFTASADRIRVREGFAIVTFSWLAMVAIGMLPFLLSGTTTSVADAFFETMSGFTTTGATVFARVERIPYGIQFWRCMTQWLGGMGIVVLSVAVLPMLGAGGYRLLKAETPGGVAFERERPRITDTAKELWLLYVGFSAAQVVALRAAGMSHYDALCHTFTTMSTGGFSPHTASIAQFGPAVQWIIIGFMVLAGVNFSLHAQALRGRIVRVSRNPELRLYLGLLACASVVAVLVLDGGEIEARIRAAVFQVVSIGTTTGYVTADYEQWPKLLHMLLLLLMFVGGSMGSTGGGIKVARLIIFGKAVARELFRPIFPHAVRPIRVGPKVLDPTLVSNILAFGTMYVAAFIVGAVVTAAHGYDLPTSASAAAAALGNIGPGLGQVGPTQHWGHLPDTVKWTMSGLMLAGRLELFSVLILLTPWAWRR